MGVDLSDAEFVGFDNYKKIVGDRRFWQSVGITLKYTAAEIPLQDVYKRQQLFICRISYLGLLQHLFLV